MDPRELSDRLVVAVYITTDGREVDAHPAQILQCVRRDGKWGPVHKVHVKGANVGGLGTVGIDPDEYQRTAVEPRNALNALDTLLKGQLGEGEALGVTTSGNWLSMVMEKNQMPRWWGKDLIGVQELDIYQDSVQHMRGLEELVECCSKKAGRPQSMAKVLHKRLGRTVDGDTFGERRLEEAKALWDAFTG